MLAYGPGGYKVEKSSSGGSFLASSPQASHDRRWSVHVYVTVHVLRHQVATATCQKARRSRVSLNTRD